MVAIIAVTLKRAGPQTLTGFVTFGGNGSAGIRSTSLLCYNEMLFGSSGSYLCGSGGTGRHTILRGWRRKAWGFKSPLPHHDLVSLDDEKNSPQRTPRMREERKEGKPPQDSNIA